MFHEFETELYETALRFHPDNLEALFSLGNAYTRIGRFEDGLGVDRRLVAMFPENPTVHYNLSCSLALLGRIDDAFGALREAVELGFDDDRLLATDPDLNGLRKDPRFQQLMAQGNA
jgi:Flp pilus assembly protein TadD